MQLPVSSALVPQLLVLEQTPSTNDELLGLAADGAAEFTTVVTLNQTAGRGRLGRPWIAPPGQTLAVSVLLRPVFVTGDALGLDRYGWIPLMAGVAMARAVASLLPATPESTPSAEARLEEAATRPSRREAEGRREGHAPQSSSARSLREPQGTSSPGGHARAPGPRVTVKWPNDVLIDDRKVSGLLSELLPSRDGAIVGAGLNLSIPRSELPTPTATSLQLNGATRTGDDLVDAALAGYLRELKLLYADFLRSGADPNESGVRQQLLDTCGTLGRSVRAELPGGAELLGTASDIDESGRLIINTHSDAGNQAVAAGDITHLR